MKLLHRYSLIEEVEDLGSYSTHPVIHKWVYHRFCNGMRTLLGLAAIELVGAAFHNLVLLDDAELQYRILPHIKSCVQRILEEEPMQAHDSADRGELLRYQ